MNTVSRISQKRNLVSHKNNNNVKKAKSSPISKEKINWNLLKFHNPLKLTPTEIDTYKSYFALTKKDLITYAPYITFDEKRPLDSDLSEANYSFVYNTITCFANNNIINEDYKESILQHELSHYKDHMKIEYALSLYEKHSPLIPESHNKYFEDYKKNVVQIRTNLPNGKDINARIKRKIRDFESYPSHSKKLIIEESLQLLEDLYALTRIKGFLAILTNTKNQDFEFDKNQDLIYIIKEILDNFKASKSTIDFDKKTISEILKKINSHIEANNSLKDSKNTSKFKIQFNNHEKQVLNNVLSQFYKRGIYTEQKSYVINENFNKNTPINQNYLSRYYLGLNPSFLKSRTPLFSEYDKYINKRNLKQAPYLSDLHTKIPSKFQISPDYQIALYVNSSVDDKTFDLMLKAYILKMMIAHNQLPDLKDFSSLYQYLYIITINPVSTLPQSFKQKKEQHIKDLQNEFIENGPAIKQLKKECVCQLLTDYRPSFNTNNTLRETSKALAAYKILTKLSQNFSDIDENKKTQILNLINKYKDFYLSQILPESKQFVNLTDEEIKLYIDMQNFPDKYFNL